jgi:uncharacterized LabA/DUF88 family protein
LFWSLTYHLGVRRKIFGTLRPPRKEIKKMKDFTKRRSIVFIDGENLEIRAKSIYGYQVNYRELSKHFNYREYMQVFYYTKTVALGRNARRNKNHLLPSFVKLLTKDLGFHIKTTPKNCDVYLAMHAVAAAPKIDRIVLLSGDKDFLPLIYYLQAHGVWAEVWSFEQSTADDLRAAADVFVPLTARILTVPKKETNNEILQPDSRNRSFNLKLP